MQLSCEHRRVGDADVLTCVGRITAGPEVAALQAKLDTLTERSRHVVLHLGGVDFIDSSGLGLLVRYLLRTRRMSGTLTVCAVSPKIEEVLRITRLKPVFPVYDSEADAISDAYRRDLLGAAETTVLCVDASTDITTYLRELLRVAGYRAISAQNLPDALTLLIATNPKVVLMSDEFGGFYGTRTAEEFHRLAAGRVVTLPPGFSGHDAGDAAGEVLRAVGAAC